MNIIQTIEQYDIKNVFFLDPIKNNIINDSIFFRLVYSTPYVSLNGINLYIPLVNITIDKNFYKYKAVFNIQNNNELIEQFKQLEFNLLTSISTMCYNLTPQYNIYEQLLKGSVYFFSNNKKQNIIILKISGIWSNNENYGLTYKFMHQTQN
jgi:hypothetical protein